MRKPQHSVVRFPPSSLCLATGSGPSSRRKQKYPWSQSRLARSIPCRRRKCAVAASARANAETFAGNQLAVGRRELFCQAGGQFISARECLAVGTARCLNMPIKSKRAFVAMTASPSTNREPIAPAVPVVIISFAPVSLGDLLEQIFHGHLFGVARQMQARLEAKDFLSANLREEIFPEILRLSRAGEPLRRLGRNDFHWLA